MLLADGKFTCEFELHTKPDFELAQYKQLEIPKPDLPYTETEITEKMLQELRVKCGETVPYSTDDFVQSGDNIIIDYEATLDGAKIDTLCAKGEMMTVGSNQLISMF